VSSISIRLVRIKSEMIPMITLEHTKKMRFGASAVEAEREQLTLRAG
ncbi:MAG: hypothetical protein JWO63_2657, partial [Frankiales bacterium]|nr:hypothetical protein [Frankiales bacterium]